MIEELINEKYMRAWKKMKKAGLITYTLPVTLRYPEFHRGGGWKDKVPEDIKMAWPHLSPKQKYLACYYAEQEIIKNG